MTTTQKSFALPLAFIGMMFFAIGFALGINSFLMPVLEGSMHMSAADSNLLLAATFVPFLIFSIPATKCIELIGYKKTMALSFALFAGSFGLFIQAAASQSLSWFLIASFAAGASNAVLQASVNPYITILGPMESAAKRISIMGICNKLAWPATTLFITLVIGKTIDQIQPTDLFRPFQIIIVIFIILGVMALMAPLPEVKAAGEDSNSEEDADACPYAKNKTSIFQFPHLLLGVLALFLYVGVETISLATATGYAKALGLEGDNYGFIPSIGMVIGYICGVIFIPKYLSQVTAMKICATIAIIGAVLVAVLPAELSIYCISLMALGCSLMWPALWPLAMSDLGKFTKSGASLLTMAIAGGAVMPWLRGVIQDITDFQTSYWVCVPCFLFILYYGIAGYKIRKK